MSAVFHSGRTLTPLVVTVPTQELQRVSDVIHSGRTLTPLSHFMDPGAPGCERCAPFWKNLDPCHIVQTQELQNVSAVIHSGSTLTPLALYGPKGSRV